METFCSWINRLKEGEERRITFEVIENNTCKLYSYNLDNSRRYRAQWSPRVQREIRKLTRRQQILFIAGYSYSKKYYRESKPFIHSVTHNSIRTTGFTNSISNTSMLCLMTVTNKY